MTTMPPEWSTVMRLTPLAWGTATGITSLAADGIGAATDQSSATLITLGLITAGSSILVAAVSSGRSPFRRRRRDRTADDAPMVPLSAYDAMRAELQAEIDELKQQLREGHSR